MRSRRLAAQARAIRTPFHMIGTINELIGTSHALVQELGRRPRDSRFAASSTIPRLLRRLLRRRRELLAETGRTAAEAPPATAHPGLC